MFKLKIFLLVVLCLQKLNAQIPIPEIGVCSPSPVISDFDITKVRKKKKFVKNKNNLGRFKSQMLPYLVFLKIFGPKKHTF